MKGNDVNDVVDFAKDLLKTPPDDLDRRIGEVSTEMLRRLAKNIVIHYQNLNEIARGRKRENGKLRFYAEKLENLLLRAVGPGVLGEATKDKDS